MVSRIATFANATALLTASLKVQAKLADQQSQEASSLKSASFSGLGGGDVGRLLDLNGQSARLTAESDAATHGAALVQSAYSAVGQIVDLATTVKTRLSAAMSGGASGTGTLSGVDAQDATSWLQTLQAALNTEVGGEYVFAGQASDRAPADFTASGYDPSAAPDTADTGYFQGSPEARTLQTSSGQTMPLSVTADQPGFEQLGRALSLITANPSDPATLSKAFDQVSAALNDLATTQSGLSDQAAGLDQLSSDNQVKVTTLGNLAQQIKGADLSTAAVLVTQYQTQLDAIYGAMGKLASDSLLKYL